MHGCIDELVAPDYVGHDPSRPDRDALGMLRQLGAVPAPPAAEVS